MQVLSTNTFFLHPHMQDNGVAYHKSYKTISYNLIYVSQQPKQLMHLTKLK
jgi:hypothetical protein